MQIAYIIEFTVFFMLTLIINPKKINIGLIFLIAWNIFVVVSTSGIMGMQNPSSLTHLCVLISISSFMLAYLITHSINNKLLVENEIFVSVKQRSMRKLLVFANICTYLFMMPLLVKAVAIAGASGYDFLRDVATTNSDIMIDSTIVRAFIDLFVVSLYICTLLITVVNMIFEEKKDYSLITVAMIDVAMYSMIFASRAIIVRFIMYILFALFLISNRNNQFAENSGDSKIRVWLKLFSVAATIVGCIWLITFITTARSEALSVGLLDNVIIYYGGPFSLFDFYISNPDMSRLTTDNLLLGTAMFGFVYNIIPNALFILFGISYFGSDYIITQITAVAQPISQSLDMNAATTAMYPFMRDFSYPGLIIGFGLLGLFVAKSEILLRKSNSERQKAIFIFLCYVVFKSVQSYELLTPQGFFILMYLLCFSSNATISYKNTDQ